MPKKQVPEEIILLFEQVTGSLEGWHPDEISVNRVCVESNFCPHCGKSLRYRGWTDFKVLRNFGVCMNCRYARHFWDEGGELAAEKAICESAKREKRAA